MIRAVLFALALAGCATAAPPEPIAASPALPSPTACRGEALTDLVGKPGTAALADEALRRSGARTIRWIGPDTAVTMDFRPDRLNIRIDQRNVVVSFDCA